MKDIYFVISGVLHISKRRGNINNLMTGGRDRFIQREILKLFHRN